VTEANTSAPVPAVSFLHFDEVGCAYLRGARCADCGAVAPGERHVCNACGARGRMKSIRLSESGTLYSYTIVHRSFPGVQTSIAFTPGGKIALAYQDATPVDLVFATYDPSQNKATGRSVLRPTLAILGLHA